MQLSKLECVAARINRESQYVFHFPPLTSRYCDYIPVCAFVIYINGLVQPARLLIRSVDIYEGEQFLLFIAINIKQVQEEK